MFLFPTSLLWSVYQTMDQNKALSPSWNMCIFIADIAMQEDNSKLAFYALEFMARWIARGENARGPVLLSVDEGLVVSTLGTAGRTYSSTLLDASWAILRDHCVKRRHLNQNLILQKYMPMQHWGICREHSALCMSLKPLIGTPPKKQKRTYSHLLHLYILW